jgi:hypothetical protein
MFPAAALTPLWIEHGQAHIEHQKPAPALRSPAEPADLCGTPRDKSTSSPRVKRYYRPMNRRELFRLLPAAALTAPWIETGQAQRALLQFVGSRKALPVAASELANPCEPVNRWSLLDIHCAGCCPPRAA